MHLSSIPLCLSQEVQAGPAKKVHMSQCPGHQSGPAEPRFCPQRQRCQPGWAHTALSELLWSGSLLHMFPKFVMRLRSLSQPGYINETREGTEGIRGERNQQSGGGVRETKASHTIQLCSVGLQRPASYFHATLNYTNPCPHVHDTHHIKSHLSSAVRQKKNTSVAAQRSI